MPGIVGIYANDANYDDEPCIVDGDCHSSAKGLAQSVPFKSKENNLDTTDNNKLMKYYEVLAMTTFSTLAILPTLETKMVDARHMRLRPGRFLNS